MSVARDHILGRIRAAIDHGGRPDAHADYMSVGREYQRAPRLDRQERLRLFTSRLEDYDCGVVTCGSEAVRETIASVLASRGRPRLVVPPGFPDAYLPKDLDLSRDDQLSTLDIERFGGVMTSCAVAIAFTGTIVLTHSDAEGRRALTLLPDYHLCVVPQERIVDTLPEAFVRIQATRPGLITTISGPSATADIEMTRIRGVHGPRTLDVIIVTSP